MNHNNPQYWNKHKYLLMKEMDKLDNETYYKITNDPSCKESIDLNIKVKEALEKEP
jgi:hypothetical protein